MLPEQHEGTSQRHEMWGQRTAVCLSAVWALWPRHRGLSAGGDGLGVGELNLGRRMRWGRSPWPVSVHSLGNAAKEDITLWMWLLLEAKSALRALDSLSVVSSESSRLTVFFASWVGIEIYGVEIFPGINQFFSYHHNWGKELCNLDHGSATTSLPLPLSLSHPSSTVGLQKCMLL